MSTAIDKEERGLYYLVSIKGEFVVRSLMPLRESLEKAMTIGHTNIAFDLSGTSYIDSSGIGLLANLNSKLVARGGSAYLIGVEGEVLNAMEPSGLLSVIPCFPSVEEADKQIG